MQFAVSGPGIVTAGKFFSKSMLEQSNVKAVPDGQTVQVAQASVPIVMEHSSNANPPVENSAQISPIPPTNSSPPGMDVSLTLKHAVMFDFNPVSTNKPAAKSKVMLPLAQNSSGG